MHAQFAFALSALVAETAGLKKGMELSREQVEELLSRDQFQKAIDSALNFLSYRPRSEKEVRQNLLRKRYSDGFIDKIVERLKEMRMIDDTAFARFWVENRDVFSPRSHRALKSELRAKGVDAESLDEAMEDAADQDTSALEVARKKQKSLKGLEYKDFRQKLGSFLARRGYDYQTSKRAVDAVWKEMMEAEEP
jgi:regulatory protein